jgi:putative endonuclease
MSVNDPKADVAPSITSSSQRKLGSLSLKCYSPDAMAGWVYIMSNKREGVLYIGVTADLSARITQHRSGKGSAFCRRYGLNRLVYAEQHSTIEDAIAREKAMKAWKRTWKIELIENANPGWNDLSDLLGMEFDRWPVFRVWSCPAFRIT